jgi:hypothetical protein
MGFVAKEYGIVAPATAEGMGLPRKEFGLLCCVDESGERWTLVGDPEFVRKLMRIPEHLRGELEVPPETFRERRAGWPDDWRTN